MAITTLDGYIASTKECVPVGKTATRTTVANGWFSVFDLAGQPGAGTLAGTSTAAGVVPTDVTAGYPALASFGGGASGYLGRLAYGSTVACRIGLFDRVFVAGAYAFNANTNLSAQPSYAARMPNSNYGGTQLWVEQVTAATGNQAVQVVYANQAGTGTRTTAATGIGAAPTVGRCWQLPLQSGDSGVSRIDNVTGSVATVGTFNVMVLRPLWYGRIVVANYAAIDDLVKVGLPQLFEESALYMMICADSTSSGIADLCPHVVSG
jgi:hypothetical protein